MSEQAEGQRAKGARTEPRARRPGGGRASAGLLGSAGSAAPQAGPPHLPTRGTCPQRTILAVFDLLYGSKQAVGLGRVVSPMERGLWWSLQSENKLGYLL